MKPVDLIKKFEGCRLRAYQCSAGKWTVGWGATGPGIEAGTVWTQRQADERLAEDLKRFEDGVRSLVREPINDNQFAALVSFAYNVGLNNLRRSGLLKHLNAGRTAEAANQFLLWNRVGSYVIPGLTRRREEERKVFLTPAAQT